MKLLADAISVLPNLSQQELLTLKAAIEELLTKTKNDDEPPLYGAIAKVLGTAPPYPIFKQTKQWQRHADNVSLFIEQNFETATKLQKYALMQFIVEALVADLKERGVPITIGTVVSNLGRFAQVWENQFPNYIKAGMQNLILKAMKGTNT